MTQPTSVSRKQSLSPLELPPRLLALFRPTAAAIQNETLPRKPVDVKARLNDPITEISLNVGLNDLLKYVSQVSTIPFTVRADSLRHSRLDPGVLTPIAAKQVTVQQLLGKALQPHKLAIRPTDDGHVIVERKAAVSGSVSTNKHNVGDLLDAGVKSAELTSLVRQLVDPPSWREIDSDTDVFVQERFLVLTQRETAHFETMFLLERLRVARGLTLQGTMDREEFKNDWERTAELTQPVALRTTKGDTLGSVVQKLNRLAGNEYHVLTDWEALAAEGWNRQSPINAAIPRQPLATALPAILQPRGLTHRCVGPRMIEITTQSAANDRSELAIHSIGSLTQAGYEPQTIMRQIEQTIGESRFRRGGGHGAIVFHDGAQALLVRLPQSQHAAVDWVIQELARL